VSVGVIKWNNASDDGIDVNAISADDSPEDNECLKYNSSTGKAFWDDCNVVYAVEFVLLEDGSGDHVLLEDSSGDIILE
jgi:hypothetical protein